MEFEDSRNALYCDPNAYIMGKKQKEVKKVVFSEPYENVPNYYLNNNFEKGKCKFCDSDKKEKEDCKNSSCNKQNTSFSLNNLMPLLTMFGGKSSSGAPDLTKILSSLGNGNGLMSLLANKDIMSTVLSLFAGNQNKKKTSNKEIISTDFEIKKYTRVE